MASSPSYRTWKYDVFTSFHGPDVRQTFISHLRELFNRYGMTMFHEERIERGQLIGPSIIQGIRESRISIIVLSKKYASSRWCLNELSEILECRENVGQIVMTVFYRVDPSDVRKQTGEFGIGFKETCARSTDEEMRKWSRALTTVGNIAGEVSQNWESEVELLVKIAKDVSNKLNAKWSTDVRKMEFGRKVDVFLSFCCKADCLTFPDILLKNGIDTFKSYRCLEKSLIPIDKPTLDALEVSKVAVVMISEKKPYTVGFLEELRVILEFREKGSLTVIPVLLTPDPFPDVEDEICQQYPENALSWRTSLTKLANIAAEYPFSQYIEGMDQSDRLNQIAHDIYLLLLSSTSNDLDSLVAMDRHMKVVHDLLASEVNKEVHTIGIWGTAGVGKTTLARCIYAEISVNFQTYVFLENVGNMKDKILKFEEEEDPTVIISSDRKEHEITEARRKHRKVLLIADDVNNIEQGKWIIEYANQFAPGSRVILISEKKKILVDAGVKAVYEVTSLRYDEALQLFSHFAFKQPYPPSDFEQLAVRVVYLLGFLPLSLRLFGSVLTGRNREEWVTALPKLKTMQGKNMMEVWKLMEATQDKGQEEKEVAPLEYSEKKGKDLVKISEDEDNGMPPLSSFRSAFASKGAGSTKTLVKDFFFVLSKEESKAKRETAIEEEYKK